MEEVYKKRKGGEVRITGHKIFDLFISYFNRYSLSHTP